MKLMYRCIQNFYIDYTELEKQTHVFSSLETDFVRLGHIYYYAHMSVHILLSNIIIIAQTHFTTNSSM